MVEIINVKSYINDISRYSRVSREEEIELGKKIKKHDKDAIDTLITANTGLVMFVANKYRHKGVLYEDLIGEGNIGLVIAASRWNYKKNTRFSTYAIVWIKKQILFALNNKSLVKVGTNLQEAANSLGNQLRGIKMEGNGKVSYAEISKKFGKKYKSHSIKNIIETSEINYCGLLKKHQNSPDTYDIPHPKLRVESFEREVENADAKVKLKIRLKKVMAKFKHRDCVADIYSKDTGVYQNVRAVGKKYGVSGQTLHNRRKYIFADINERYKFEEFKDYLKV